MPAWITQVNFSSKDQLSGVLFGTNVGKKPTHTRSLRCGAVAPPPFAAPVLLLLLLSAPRGFDFGAAPEGVEESPVVVAATSVVPAPVKQRVPVQRCFFFLPDPTKSKFIQQEVFFKAFTKATHVRPGRDREKCTSIDVVIVVLFLEDLRYVVCTHIYDLLMPGMVE